MFKPLLAPNQDPLSYPNYFKELQYPLLCSPKYDGIRCIIKNGKAYSRSGKLIPSQQVQEKLTKIEHLDGEIIEGKSTDNDVYNRTQSHVMSQNRPGNISLYAFDYTHPDWLDKPFYQRLQKTTSEISEHYRQTLSFSYDIIQHDLINNFEELLRFEEICITEGFEGIMMRSPDAPYKQGRGTWREGIIYKLKRFQEDEALIIGFKEQLHNNNTLEKDELGYAKRSYSKDGLVSAGMVGSFYVDYLGQELEIAAGSFTQEERKVIWQNQEKYLRKMLKFRFFLHGIKDKPRFPRATGFRDKRDL
jgi:DNA ligase-1